MNRFLFPPLVLYYLTIIIVTLSVFIPAIFGEFLHWDDVVLIVDNPMIAVLDWPHVVRIFTHMATQIYIPLVILSFAIERALFGLNPFWFHLNNVLLHIGSCLLILELCRRLGFSLWVAFLTAMIFAIHPIHVESVATISERKDTLYTFFYLWAMHQYLTFVASKHWRDYLGVLILVLLSMLAKPMALSLPFIFLLLDYLNKRPLRLNVFLEKAPFFIVILPSVYLALAFHKSVPPDIYKGPLLWTWSYVFYLIKFICPINLNPMYLPPYPIAYTHLPYIISGVIFVGVVISCIIFRHQRLWIFAVGYFTASIFFLLRNQDTATDVAFVTDHYMYLPSLGFCLVLAVACERFVKDKRWVMGVLCLMGVMSFQQSKIWINDLKFLEAILKANPTYLPSYNSLGHYYAGKGQLDKALEYYQKGLSGKRDYDYWIYNNIAFVYLRMGDTRKAFEYYEKSLQLYDQCPETYMNRATLYDSLGQYDLAFNDYTQAITLNPHFAQAYHNRAVLYYRKADFKAAIADLNQAIAIIPHFKSAVYLRDQIQAMIDRPKARFTLDIPPDTYDQGIWKSEEYRNHLPDKKIFYPLKK